MSYIRVAVDVPLPHLLDYACAQASQADIGRLVRVPLGKKEALGVIMELARSGDIDEGRIREAREILVEVPALPADVLRLLRFCSRYYHHPIGQVVLSAVPARYRLRAHGPRQQASLALSAFGRETLAKGLKRAPALMRTLELLANVGTLDPAARAALDPAMRRTLRSLLERGLASEVSASEKPMAAAAPRQVKLIDEQQAAVASIVAALPGFRAWLLQGVTGSGKTEVYLEVMAQVLACGQQVLFLVPEIGLTPQLESRLRDRFPTEELVVLHSALAPAQRARHWLASQNGSARIVLGTRSAVFTPLPGLGLIVVDEEHDSSYKQNEGVRYSARDLAVWRANDRAVPVVLGSATPSLESFYAAASGRYALLRLTRRPSAAAARIALVSSPQHAAEPIAPALLQAIEERMQRGEQALVFVNRRGYAPVLLCPACGWAPGCPRCSTHLVLHKTSARMLCHHCGHDAEVPAGCAGCGNVDLRPVGFGTQRIEAALRSRLPCSRLLRVDRDTTRARDSWPAMRGAIIRNEVDVVVGTQLLSKGHDFHGLSLVCVLNADRSLYSSDFRATEQLFAQLLQVSGRAGRGERPGQVLIQTSYPSHPLYAAVLRQDYDGFAGKLLEERQLARLPPFVHQALLRAEAPRLERALEFLRQAAELARSIARGIDLYDPAPAAMTRLQGRERAQLLVQADSRPALHRFLDAWTERLYALRAGRARWALDVDPQSI